MEVTKSMVKYLCELARIEFDENEYDDVVNDLQGMVDSFEILDEIENINSLKINGNKLDAETELRADTPKTGLTMEAVVKNAPESCGGAIVVPGMLDLGE